MIADALYAEMLTQADRMRQVHPLLLAAADGTLTPERIAHYLVNVRRILQHTPVFLARARERAFEVGNLPLAEFFAHKAAEEEGHDQWAENDIVAISSRAPAASGEIVPAIHEYLELTLGVIEEDPLLILAYMFFNEALVVLIGDEALSNLEKRCGIPRSCVTSVDRHIELDRDHVEEILTLIDTFVPDPKMLPRMREILLESFAIFERFGAQIMESRDARSSGHLKVHAPAA